jgi:MFS family permease
LECSGGLVASRAGPRGAKVMTEPFKSDLAAAVEVDSSTIFDAGVRRATPPLIAILSIFASSMAVGMGTTELAPFLIASLQQARGLTPSGAGLIESLELITTAVAAIGLAGHVARRGPQASAFIGCLLAAGAHVLSAYLSGNLPLAAARIAAGFGAALCLCAGNIALARQREPDRAYALCGVIGSLSFGALFPLISLVSENTGGKGVFLVQAGWTALAIPLVLLLPGRDRRDEAAVAATEARPPLRLLMLALPIFVFMVFSSGVYSFAGTAAAHIGVRPEQYAFSVSVGKIASLVIAGVVTVIASRLGRMLPLASGLLVAGLANMVFLQTHTPVVSIVANVLVLGTFTFVTPFMFGLCGALDPTGRLITTATSATLLGAAAAPVVAGVLFEKLGYSAVGWIYPLVYMAVFGSMSLLLGRRRPDRPRVCRSVAITVGDDLPTGSKPTYAHVQGRRSQ